MKSDDPTARPPRRPSDDDLTRRADAAGHRAGDQAGEATRTVYNAAESRTVEAPDQREAGADPLAALERLQTLGAPGADAPSSPLEPVSPRPPRAPRGRRPRPRAAARIGGLPLPRLIAPAVFLVAVIILLILVFDSGVLSGNAKTTTKSSTPTVVSTKKAGATGTTGTTASPSATKIYVVKAGDSPSGIAAKFGISTSDLEALNPTKDFTTLAVGLKLKVPRQ